MIGRVEPRHRASPTGHPPDPGVVPWRDSFLVQPPNQNWRRNWLDVLSSSRIWIVRRR